VVEWFQSIHECCWLNQQFTDAVWEQCIVSLEEFGADETSESRAEAAGDSEGVVGPGTLRTSVVK
jgi:hypothetical protein